ncbi:hypothetical protein BDF14DRAFT_137666 [Spinellus fusiger]|nr:hypothetical protein BDF14DRAFT_137666 [Spinellus fusiger]
MEATKSQSDSKSRDYSYFSNIHASTSHKDCNSADSTLYQSNETDMTEKDPQLPSGWVLRERKQSAMELETNIRTLGELYQTLASLRGQLPSPIATAIESDSQLSYCNPLPSNPTLFLFRNPSSITSSEFSLSALDTPVHEKLAKYPMTLDGYPSCIFTPLVQLYLGCVSYPRTDKDAFIESHRTGTFEYPALTCAMYAYSAIHAFYCHPNIVIPPYYPLLLQLGKEYYAMARDLVEFDRISLETVETLILMYLYLVRMGDPMSSGEANNLFCLAVRQLSMLPKHGTSSENLNRLWSWVATHDLALAAKYHTLPLLQTPPSIKAPMRRNYSDDFALSMLMMEKEGLSLIVHDPKHTSSSQLAQLEEWRSRVTATQKKYGYDTASPFAIHCMHFQALYLIGCLNLHEADMMRIFEAGQYWQESSSTHYFEVKEGNLNHEVESALGACMNIAFGLISTVQQCLSSQYLCRIPEIANSLSAACTMLYFGSKVAPSDIAKESEDALFNLMDAFSSTLSLMENPVVREFVEKWCVTLKMPLHFP